MGPGWAPDARNIDNIGPSEANTGTTIAIHTTSLSIHDFISSRVIWDRECEILKFSFLG